MRIENIKDQAIQRYIKFLQMHQHTSETAKRTLKDLGLRPKGIGSLKSLEPGECRVEKKLMVIKARHTW